MLLDTIVEKLPERSNIAAITEITCKGLEDTAEECLI